MKRMEKYLWLYHRINIIFLYKTYTILCLRYSFFKPVEKKFNLFYYMMKIQNNNITKRCGFWRSNHLSSNIDKSCDDINTIFFGQSYKLKLIVLKMRSFKTIVTTSNYLNMRTMKTILTLDIFLSYRLHVNQL